MIKILVMLRKRADISVEEFRRLYEEEHAPLAVRYLRVGAARYFRRFLSSDRADLYGAAQYHVMTEMWYDDEASYAAARSALDSDEARAALRRDEDRMFDPDRTRMFVVEERESDLAAARRDQ